MPEADPSTTFTIRCRKSQKDALEAMAKRSGFNSINAFLVMTIFGATQREPEPVTHPYVEEAI